MKKLFTLLIITIVSLLLPSLSFAKKDPNDPFNKLVCPNLDFKSFCGGKKASFSYNANSCFESKLALPGCYILYGKSSILCHWPQIYIGERSMKASSLCLKQKQYCISKGYTDCTLNYNNCIKYQDTFKSECL